MACKQELKSGQSSEALILRKPGNPEQLQQEHVPDKQHNHSCFEEQASEVGMGDAEHIAEKDTQARQQIVEEDKQPVELCYFAAHYLANEVVGPWPPHPLLHTGVQLLQRPLQQSADDGLECSQV